ncbi:MAG: hypothetical protein K8H88_30985 [Sandaracinaceae bacterium]|nr:hypothetical protein [Sandaracinaceae bacterium]
MIKKPSLGLTHLATTDLENLLRALHRGQLTCPIGPRELTAAGLAYLQDRVEALKGLDQSAVRAVLVAVIAERKNERQRKPPA